MTMIISLTNPMSEFKKFFENGEDVENSVDLSACTDFWAKGTNSECLIYNGRQIVFSCCYTEAYKKLFITSVWCKSGCAYQYELDYDKLEKTYRV